MVAYPEDTYDKVDRDILMKDAGMLCEIVCELAVLPALPFDVDGYFEGVRSALKRAAAASDPEFSFEDLKPGSPPWRPRPAGLFSCAARTISRGTA